MSNSPSIGIAFLLLTLTVFTGCSLQTGAQKPSSQSGASESSASSSKPVDVCDCPQLIREDEFNAALQALVRGEYDVARDALERHEASGNAMTASEADAGRDLTDILSRYMGDAVPVDSMEGTDRAVLINLVLALIDRLERNIATLGAQNAELAADLEKREEALKRLRELTLGQPEA